MRAGERHWRNRTRHVIIIVIMLEGLGYSLSRGGEAKGGLRNVYEIDVWRV